MKNNNPFIAAVLTLALSTFTLPGCAITPPKSDTRTIPQEEPISTDEAPNNEFYPTEGMAVNYYFKLDYILSQEINKTLKLIKSLQKSDDIKDALTELKSQLCAQCVNYHLSPFIYNSEQYDSILNALTDINSTSIVDLSAQLDDIQNDSPNIGIYEDGLTFNIPGVIIGKFPIANHQQILEGFDGALSYIQNAQGQSSVTDDVIVQIENNISKWNDIRAQYLLSMQDGQISIIPYKLVPKTENSQPNKPQFPEEGTLSAGYTDANSKNMHVPGEAGKLPGVPKTPTAENIENIVLGSIFGNGNELVKS